VLGTVADLPWESKEILTAENIDALIVDVVVGLKDDGVNDIVFSRWDSFVAAHSQPMDGMDLAIFWIRVKVQKMIEKERKRRRRRNDPVDQESIINGNFMVKDGRNVFETSAGQQFLINEDGSMLNMGLGGGAKVTLIQGNPTTLALLDDKAEGLATVFREEHPEFRDVAPGFIGLQTSELIRFDRTDGKPPLELKIELLYELPEIAQQAISQGMFVFCFLVESDDDSWRFMTPEYPKSSLETDEAQGFSPSDTDYDPANG